MAASVPSGDVSVVEARFRGLRDVEARLAELVGELEERLAPVLGPQLPEESSVPEFDAPGASPVAQGLANAERMVSFQASRLADLLRRLEL